MVANSQKWQRMVEKLVAKPRRKGENSCYWLLADWWWSEEVLSNEGRRNGGRQQWRKVKMVVDQEKNGEVEREKKERGRERGKRKRNK